MHPKHLLCAFLLTFASATLASADDSNPSPALIAPKVTAPPPGSPKEAPEPPADPEKVADTKLRLRSHAQQIYFLMEKERDRTKKLALNQMITDCGYMIRFGSLAGLRYSVMQKEEQKLTAMLQDGTIDDKELAEWHKDMLTKVGTGGPGAIIHHPLQQR